MSFVGQSMVLIILLVCSGVMVAAIVAAVYFYLHERER